MGGADRHDPPVGGGAVCAYFISRRICPLSFYRYFVRAKGRNIKMTGREKDLLMAVRRD